jgi:hypothetical protein
MILKMNINRYNYEEFFLLYVDGELSAGERKSVEDFVVLNPDLEEELSMLKQSLLKPDHSVVMENKSVLFRNESSPLITLENYETFFLLYVDEELSTEERRVVETFASKHPSLQDELQLLMQTRLQTDENILFPDKNILYKVPAIGRTSVVRMYRIAAIAVIFILAIGIYWLMPGEKSNTVNPGIANTTPSHTTPKQETKVSARKIEDEQVKHQDLIAATTKSTGSAQEKKNQSPENKNTVESMTKKVSEREPTTVAASESEDVAIRPSTIQNTTALAVNMEGSNKFANTTLIVDQPVEQTKTESKNLLTRADEEPDELQTKSKLRGFFRQVKRVVDKTTHLPGEENKKLLIGNIEIALK